MKKSCLANIGCAVSMAVGLMLVLATPSRANVLDLSYTATPDGPGIYLYNFQLTLTNTDGSWAPGQGWDWIIFGDCAGPCTSPLTNWSGLSQDSPFVGFTTSSGGHNGPTLNPVINSYWVPTAVGDTLKWSGTSTADLGQGQ